MRTHARTHAHARAHARTHTHAHTHARTHACLFVSASVCDCDMLEVLRMRAGLFRQWRRQHGNRLRQDRVLTSIQVSLQLRLGWASGTWLQDLQVVADFWRDERSLRGWGILGSIAAPGTNPFLLNSFERLSRVFWGLNARAHVIWEGGVYNSVLLCGSDGFAVDGAAQRILRLYHRILALEAALDSRAAAEAGLPAVAGGSLEAFSHEFIWRHGCCYQELFSMIYHGRLPLAQVYAWRCHSGESHEKGSLVRCGGYVEPRGMFSSSLPF